MRWSLSSYNQDDYDRGRNNFVIIFWWIIQATIFRFSFHNMYEFRAILLRCFGADIGKGTKIRSSAKFTYPWKVKIGDYSWVGDQVTFYSLDNIVIGSNTIISQNSYLCTGTHDIRDSSFKLITKPVYVGDCCWVATDCFIHPGIRINDNSIISAKSNVLKDTERGFIYAGNPAKKIKKREIE